MKKRTTVKSGLRGLGSTSREHLRMFKAHLDQFENLARKQPSSCGTNYTNVLRMQETLAEAQTHVRSLGRAHKKDSKFVEQYSRLRNQEKLFREKVSRGFFKDCVVKR